MRMGLRGFRANCGRIGSQIGGKRPLPEAVFAAMIPVRLRRPLPCPQTAGQNCPARFVPAVGLDTGQAQRGRFERGGPPPLRMEWELG
jgi:hypothetical protein